ncbi:MAG: hypothetical protein A3E87_09870 [Gammaproteobacteria bacterium RIFCSPHIGHO2_12_FULL_35_23]|nr:MAG: hypothetical protein A3E87_09870 [Gammaproteobacteria bacterium RIFCSPHIGHO2_12_FULL_35_23]
MKTTNKSFHIIKDPVHGSMQFTDEENNWIKPFIDSPNFQRLRHIKQLGLGDLVFPGAVHTRFNHALGCCYVAGQIATKLNLTARERRVVMIAGLLHDIGHGPFSHAFEGIFYQSAIKHEDWTPLFLKEYLSTKFVNEFNKRNKSGPITVEELNLIKNLIMHKEQEKKLLADIVSSQLDADRLDYLRRDSHFCGVTYGVYDFQWLLHCMAIVEDKTKTLRLGITEKGIGVVEQYLMARRLMMHNVYHNGKKYAAEFLLTSFLKYLAKSVWEEGLFAEIKEKNLAKFLAAVTQFNHQAKTTKNINSLKKSFLMSNYNLYKRLCDYDVFSMIRYFAGLTLKHPVVEIAERLYSRRLPKILHIDAEHLSQTQELIASLKKEKKLKPWQVSLVQLPHQSYVGSKDPILVINKKGRVKNLHDYSLVISGLSDKEESSCLVYLDKEALSLNAVQTFYEKLS